MDEECDDGNLINLDGCTSNCKKEIGWTCPVQGTPCGDGFKVGDELCDDGDTYPGGCNQDCTGVDVGFACSGGTE